MRIVISRKKYSKMKKFIKSIIKIVDAWATRGFMNLDDLNDEEYTLQCMKFIREDIKKYLR